MFGLIGKLFLKLLGGSRNERLVRTRMRFVTEEVNPLEIDLRGLSDEEIRQRSDELRRRLAGGEHRDRIKAEAFALVREASRRARNHRQFDVQLAAGMVLDEGCIAEEATGEGKTIACYPAIYMAVLEGMKVHVITTNDYLVQRDAEFARPVFALLGISVGYIISAMPSWGETGDRKAAYACDVTYGTNSEFGFDYLRDNTKTSLADQVQGPLDFAIVDEVDNILIDEARTPLIISGPAHGDVDRFRQADAVARKVIDLNRDWDRAEQRVQTLQRKLKALDGEISKADGNERKKLEQQREQAENDLVTAEEARDREVKHYEIEMDRKSVHMTHEGVGAAQDIAGVGSFYVGANMEWPHLMEQALRAHLVYERDKDYVVQNGEVVIVDEFTGRLMEGRQWSEGLHQAVEAKERVTVKQESQTMATVTIQNYFKQYKKLAGMTGTALTEAEEFMKIYKLDVVAVTTHRPVNRQDRQDRIYAEVDAKYDAIVEEIRTYSRDMKRPVLVGTTSVEKSEKLSEMLTRRYGIEHQVLNARPENAAREADIVAEAGRLRPLKQGSKELVGTVTIATNMAGRGTDIKLGEGVVYPKCKVPPLDELEKLGLEIEDLFPPGTTKCCINCQQYDPATNCAHCFKPKLDPDFPKKGRKECSQQVPCGLHIVATERHEARRIDNQLRGRAGRQGDPGSSRFFLSLRDELMAIFAGEWTLKVLGWLGLSGDVAIEDRRISKGIERAQKKVEQRNFEIRKNLLEYDEVMDYQRRGFYGNRQRILEGRDLEGLVWKMIDRSINDAVDNYLDGRYAQRCIAEWARQNLQIPVQDSQIRASQLEDLPELEVDLRDRTKEEAGNVIAITLGEYMSDDIPADEWDLRGLSAWAMSRFQVSLSQNQLRKMTPQDVEQELNAAAAEKIDQTDMTPLVRFLQPDFVAASLAEWARSKFTIDAAAQDIAAAYDNNGPSAVTTLLLEKVQAAYHRHEIEYPVEHAIDMTIAQAGTENVYALQGLADWVNRKYGRSFTTEDFQGREIADIRDQLVELSREWTDGDKLQQYVRSELGSDPSSEKAAEFAAERFYTSLNAADLNGDAFDRVVQAGQAFLRREMTELERFVLLQINDNAWIDHLLAMDHLKSGIGLRGFAEQDPKLAYKREGSRMYHEMYDGIREKVTDMIFKVRMTAGAEAASAYRLSNTVHEQLSGYDHLAQNIDAQQAQAAGERQKVETIVRDVPKVGRNDPCPCGSGKKYKKCCGQVG